MNNVSAAQQAAAQELLRRQEALRSMWDYREFIEPSGELDFKHEPAPHHDKIIDALHFLEYGEDWDGNPVSKVLIMLPPGSAKSTYGSVQFPTWYAARHPSHNILACSNTTDLAENFNRRRRGVAFTKQWQTLADTSIDKNNQGVGRFQFAAGGSMHAAGVGSAIVGLRADLLILDDPITSFEQAMSRTQLDKIWAWYESDARSRLLPGGKELIITTRWARHDPAGRILDLIESGVERGWHVVRLPMLADSPHDPLGRAFGDPLWPEWFSQEQIDRNQRNPLVWQSQYQQVPLDEAGSWVDMDHIQLVDNHQIPADLNIVIAMDLALSVGKGDYTVFMVAGIDSRRRLYVLNVHRRQYAIDDAVTELERLVEMHSPSAILIDDDPAAKAFRGMCHEMFRRGGKPIALTALPLRGRDKETRAAAIRGLFMQGAVFIKSANFTSDLVTEINSFPSGDHDDQIDCLSLIGRRLPALATPRPTLTEGEFVLKEILVKDENGNLLVNKALDDLFSENEQRVLFNKARI